jgi:hypothetical protein
MYRVEGDDNAIQLFEFLAGEYTKENGRPLEWTHAKIGKKVSGNNMIGTSHQKSSTRVGHHLRESGWTLREVNHNHPSGNPYPSWEQDNGIENSKRGDVPAAKLYETQFPKIKLNIYTPKYKYSPYDSKGTLDERLLNF